MQIRLYKTADNPRKLAKSYTPDQTIARTFENVDAAVFENGSEYNIAALKLDFEAQQSGEGDPSPDNVRPITGHTQATVNLRSGNDFRAVFKPFGDTYYGGTFDAVSGILTVTWYAVTYNNNNGWIRGANGIFYIEPSVPYNRTDGLIYACSKYKFVGYTNNNTDAYNKGNLSCSFRITYNPRRIYVRDDNYETADEFKASVADGITFLYALDTPKTYNVGPLTGLNLFPGQNRLFATGMTINQLALSVKSGSALITTDNGTEYSNVQFISENDRKNPVLRVVTDTDLTAYNYAYISYYDRFYFVKVRNIAQGVYALECSVDLLMTCKTDLLNLNCTIKRNAASGSPYLYDELYHTQMYKLWAAKEFPQGLTNESFVLMTVGTNTTP